MIRNYELKITSRREYNKSFVVKHALDVDDGIRAELVGGGNRVFNIFPYYLFCHQFTVKVNRIYKLKQKVICVEPKIIPRVNNKRDPGAALGTVLQHLFLHASIASHSRFWTHSG